MVKGHEERSSEFTVKNERVVTVVASHPNLNRSKRSLRLEGFVQFQLKDQFPPQ